MNDEFLLDIEDILQQLQRTREFVISGESKEQILCCLEHLEDYIEWLKEEDE